MDRSYRNYFAAAALEGMLAGMNESEKAIFAAANGCTKEDALATRAVAYADALIEALARPAAKKAAPQRPLSLVTVKW